MTSDLTAPALPVPADALVGRRAGGVTLRAFCVDSAGVEHVTIAHTTIPLEVFQSKADVIRAAVEHFHSEIGMHLLSLQRDLEETSTISESQDPCERAAPVRRLRLVASGGRRVMAEGVRILAASAGLSEEQARAAVYGEEP